MFAAFRFAYDACTRAGALVLLAFLWVSAAVAQDAEIPTEARFGDDNIAVQLTADGAPVAGEEWMLALRFTPSGEEWHGYWSNPGDAGLGMQLALDLPEGFTLGEALYPVPETLVQELPTGPLMNHIFKGAYTVLLPVQVAEDAVIRGLPDVRGHVEYLACTDVVCVPQDAVLSAGQGGDFSRWRAESAPLLDAGASFRLTTDGELSVAIPIPASVALPEPHVFVTELNLSDPSAPQSFRRMENMLVAELSAPDWQELGPQSVEGILAFGDGSGVRFVATPGDVPPGGEPIITMNSAAGVTPPLWSLILGALVGGLILNIMPCVFPILSLKAIALVRAGGSESEAKVEGVAYTAGVVLACVALGGIMLALRAAGEQVGWAFQLQSPGVVVALLVLAAVITANFAGLFELPSIDTGSGPRKGAAGAFSTGLLAAVAATPCTGPFMAAALGAALLLPTPQALLLFAMLGLGLALPFLLLGFIPALRKALPKPGAWMETFRNVMAIPMGLTTLALIWLTVQLGGRGFALFAVVMLFGILLALVVVGRLQKAGKMAWPAFGLVAAPFLIFGAFALPYGYEPGGDRVVAQSLHSPQSFNREALAEARASGQPVFLWFTADWCVTCKVNESVAIERKAVRDAFEEAGVVTMVGDWTVRDEEITMFLTEQGAAGVPLYLWYDAGAEGEQLPQVLTQDMLIERASRGR